MSRVRGAGVQGTTHGRGPTGGFYTATPSAAPSMPVRNGRPVRLGYRHPMSIAQAAQCSSDGDTREGLDIHSLLAWTVPTMAWPYRPPLSARFRELSPGLRRSVPVPPSPAGSVQPPPNGVGNWPSSPATGHHGFVAGAGTENGQQRVIADRTAGIAVVENAHPRPWPVRRKSERRCRPSPGLCRQGRVAGLAAPADGACPGQQLDGSRIGSS